VAGGRISDEDIQKVREATDIVALVGERVPVKQRGRDFWCCCPLHNEKSPSFKMDPVTQLWHCFGCHEGGDVFGYVMKTEDLTFPEAVRRLAERAHIEIAETQARGKSVNSSRKARLKDVCKETAEYYHTQLMRSRDDGAAKARAYLAGRNLGGSVPKTWNLGYAPGRGSLVRHLIAKGYKPDELIEANVALTGRDGKLRDRFYERVMFPINDIQGDCIAFGGRIMGDGQPKYLNSQETPIFHKSEVLFGLDHAKGAMTSTGIAVVVEGYTDVIACHEAGMCNVVATLGTALTRQHIRVLSRHAKNAIVYLFDGDSAGQRAADRALGFIDSSMTPEGARNPIELRAVTLPDDLDPADFIAKRGVEELEKIISSSKQLLQYGIDRRIAAHDLSTPEGRGAAMHDALAVLAPIKDSVLAQQYAMEIASLTRMREGDVLEALGRLKAPQHFHEEASAPTGGSGRRVQAQRASEASLSASERNRRAVERNLLALCVRNPEVAIEHANSLAGTQWHDAMNAQIASSLLDALDENPQAKPASLVAFCVSRVPAAGSVLTEPQFDEGIDPSRMAEFLCEEIAIGDMEDSIASLRAQMTGNDDDLFEVVSAMQKDLEVRRANHRPL
jgi:DNA primase